MLHSRLCHYVERFLGIPYPYLEWRTFWMVPETFLSRRIERYMHTKCKLILGCVPINYEPMKLDK